VLKRHQQTVQRQRRDCHHTTALALALLRQYDVVYLEELRVRNLVRTTHLAKRISAAGWAAFRTSPEAKAACARRQVIALPPAYTSQDCSGCGECVPTRLSVRTHVCPHCGLMLDRDANAARTSLRLGPELRRAGQARQARTQRDAAYVA
jgi:putative transposase